MNHYYSYFRVEAGEGLIWVKYDDRKVSKKMEGWAEIVKENASVLAIPVMLFYEHSENYISDDIV
jgi:hypothetical protein